MSQNGAQRRSNVRTARDSGLSDNQQLLQQLRRAIRPKLTVNAPDDKYEREADRVADAVMRMPAPEASVDEQEISGERIQRMCPRCRKRARKGRPIDCPACEEELRRKEVSAAPPEADRSMEQQIQLLGGGGRPLPDSVRSFFEPRFGEDFSDVRVHTDNRADEAARSVSARAFTVGRHIAFRRDESELSSPRGKKLLAHELTHVVQHSGGGSDRSAGVRVRERLPSTVLARNGGPIVAGGRDVDVESNDERSDDGGSTVCPDAAIDDGVVQQHIDDALEHGTIDDQYHLDLAFGYLRREREQNCCDLDLAAAEHYMYARLQVVEGVPYTVMTGLILSYAGAKAMGLVPLTGDCPLTPASMSQVSWAMSGALDGRYDTFRSPDH